MKFTLKLQSEAFVFGLPVKQEEDERIFALISLEV